MRSRIGNLVALVAMFALLFACVATQGGCASSGASAGATLAPQEQRLAAVIEVRQAYATAENVVTRLTVAKFLPIATAKQVRSIFRAGRDVIETLDATLTTSGDVEWTAGLNNAWKTLDDVTAIFSPTAPKPSATRKS